MQVTPSLNAGGVETITLDIAGAVVEARGRSLVASQGGRLETDLARAGAVLIRLPVDSRNPITLWRNIARLETLIRREGVSVVHVRSRAPAFSAIAAARRAGVPVVTTYHGIYGARSPLKRWYNGVMTRGDLVIANSDFTRDHIVAEHCVSADKIVVIAEGIDTALFDPVAVSVTRRNDMRAVFGLATGDLRPVMLLPARLTNWKGHAVVIEALARLDRRETPLLIVTGRSDGGEYLNSLRLRVGELGLTEQVRFVGETADMPAAYALADVVVAPSLKAESFGRSVVEAGAMATPVIASPLGGPVETVIAGETGWFAPAGDIDAWARAIDAALNQSDRRLAEMGRAARARACSLYSRDVMAAATLAVYRRLLDRQT